MLIILTMMAAPFAHAAEGEELVTIAVSPETAEVLANENLGDLVDDVYEGQMASPLRVVGRNQLDLAAIIDESNIPPEISRRMKPKNFQRFLRNRAALLKLAHALLKPISFNDEKLANRMRQIDGFVMRSADAIAKSSRSGVVFSFSAAAGLGFSQKILDRIKSKAVRRFIPNGGGFYYVLAGGVGFFVRSDAVSGRRFLDIEVFFDGDRLKKIHTYAAEGSLAFNWGVALDRGARSGFTRMDSHYVGILGVVRQSQEHFSYSLITGLAIPPYLPVGMVYTNRTTRLRLPLMSLPWFRHVTGRDGSSAGESDEGIGHVRHTCEALFSTR